MRDPASYATIVVPQPVSEASMTGFGGVEGRRHSRVRLPVSAEITCMPLNRFRQTAYLRDISAGGAFIYAGLTPAVGDQVHIDFSVPVVGNEVRITCEGSVVRVEAAALGENNGIAIRFAKLHLGAR